MSTAPQLRSRVPRIGPQLAQAAVARARLTLVPRPRPRSRAPQVPFVVLISAVLLAGVVGLLLFNTSMQQASFRETKLEGQAGDLSARQEALEMRLEELRDPQRIARRAQRMGLVIPTSPAGMLDLDDGAVAGDPRPAEAARPLPLDPPPPRRPAQLDPPPVTADPVTTGAPDSDRATTRGRNGGERQQ
jgi:hypothetical protein